MSDMDTRLTCLEFYGCQNLSELIAAVDVPAAQARECAVKIGKMLCRIRARDALNCALVDFRGETVERMLVYR